MGWRNDEWVTHRRSAGSNWEAIKAKPKAETVGKEKMGEARDTYTERQTDRDRKKRESDWLLGFLLKELVETEQCNRQANDTDFKHDEFERQMRDDQSARWA